MSVMHLFLWQYASTEHKQTTMTERLEAGSLCFGKYSSVCPATLGTMRRILFEAFHCKRSTNND